MLSVFLCVWRHASVISQGLRTLAVRQRSYRPTFLRARSTTSQVDVVSAPRWHTTCARVRARSRFYRVFATDRFKKRGSYVGGRDFIEILANTRNVCNGSSERNEKGEKSSARDFHEWIIQLDEDYIEIHRCYRLAPMLQSRKSRVCFRTTSYATLSSYTFVFFT